MKISKNTNPEYDSIRVILLILGMFGLFIFIYLNIFNRSINLGQVIVPSAGAVLPELLSSNIDSSFDGLFDTNNADFHLALQDLGLNSLMMFGGTNANLGHWGGYGLGVDSTESNFYETPIDAKKKESDMTTTYNGSTYGIPATKFHDKFIDAVKNLRSTTAIYGLNVVTQRAADLVMTAPVPIDQPSLDAAITENTGLIQNLVANGVTVGAVQLCSECQSTTHASLFPTASHFSQRVGPIAQAINASYPNIRLIMHVATPKSSKKSTDWGASTTWNDELKNTTNTPLLWNYVNDVGIYISVDGIEDTDTACNPATHSGIDIFACFRDNVRTLLDTDLLSILDSYSNYFGTSKGIRIEQFNLDNYDSTGDETFSTSAFDNTFASSAYIGEFLFKLANYNKSHNDIVKSASIMNFSGGIKGLMSKKQSGTNDDTIPTNEMYKTYYTKNALKYQSAGLTFRLIKDVFDGVHKVLDNFTFAIPSFVPASQLQVYGFQDINSSKNLYYFFNWSNQQVNLSAIKLKGTLAVDPAASLTLTSIKGQGLSSAYGVQNIWNTAAFTPLTTTIWSPVSITGTTNVMLPPYSITKIDGIKPGKLNTGAELITVSSPISGSDNNTPYLIGTAATSSTVNIYTTSTCTGEKVGTGTAAAFTSPGISVTVVNNTFTTFYANTVSGSTTSACSTGFVYTEITADSTAPIITSISATPSDVSATITWSTDEAGSTFADYGLTSSYGSTAPEIDKDPRVKSHTLTLTGLLPSTTYHYKAKSNDSANNLGKSGDKTFTTGSKIIAAPSITSTSPVSGSNNNYPKIKGTATDGTTVKIYKDSCTGILYVSGLAADFKNPGLTGTTNGVADNSTTTFYATATDSGNNVSACSAGFTYQEVTPDTKSPVITYLDAVTTSTTVTITWTTDESSSSYIDYGLTNSYGITTPEINISPVGVTTHTVVITGLSPNTKYFNAVKSTDAAGNVGKSGGHNFKTLP